VLPPYDAGVGAELVRGLLDEMGLPATLDERADLVDLVGAAHPYDTSFPVVECAASVVGSIGAAASLLWEERTGEAQPVTVPRGHAGARREVATSPIGTHAPASMPARGAI
jgi:hypothetical protein